jgi:hypothetical protein
MKQWEEPESTSALSTVEEENEEEDERDGETERDGIERET